MKAVILMINPLIFSGFKLAGGEDRSCHITIIITIGRRGCLLGEAIASNNSLDYGDVALSCFIEDKKNFLHVGGGHIPHLPSLPHVALQPCIHCSPPMVFPHILDLPLIDCYHCDPSLPSTDIIVRACASAFLSSIQWQGWIQDFAKG